MLQFSERSFSFFCRHRFPEEIIRNAILYTMFVSTRNVTFLVSETIQFKPSNVSAYNWMKKFAYLMSKQRRRASFSVIDVDNYILGRDKELENVKDLASMMEKYRIKEGNGFTNLF